MEEIYYVKYLPKNCVECVMSGCQRGCKKNSDEIRAECQNKRAKNCPLHSLTEHDAEKDKQNQVFKTRWEKLKKILNNEYVSDKREYGKTGLVIFEHYNQFNDWVLDRMQELEKEKEDEQK